MRAAIDEFDLDVRIGTGGLVSEARDEVVRHSVDDSTCCETGTTVPIPFGKKRPGRPGGVAGQRRERRP